MSKYTTEVRFICESIAGLTESVGYNEVDTIIEQSWDKIFDKNIPIFDEEYRKTLFSKILRHYWTKEIGFETVGLWKLKINTKLREIMPYYNKLYESELIDFNPLEDMNIKRDYTKTFDSTVKVDGETANSGTLDRTVDTTGSTNSEGTSSNEISGTSSSATNDTKSHLDTYSDTPQGAVTNLENNTYLTNARKITDTDNSTISGTESSQSSTENSQNSSATSKTIGKDVNSSGGTSKSETVVDNIDTYIETLSGRSGRMNSAEMIMKFRESLLNIDMLIIEQLYDMFMLIW